VSPACSYKTNKFIDIHLKANAHAF
jgi:hypothetical protein